MKSKYVPTKIHYSKLDIAGRSDITLDYRNTLTIFVNFSLEETTCIPSSIWIIRMALFNFQGARMVDQYFIHKIAAFPTFWPFSTPNTIYLLKLDPL